MSCVFRSAGPGDIAPHIPEAVPKTEDKESRCGIDSNEDLTTQRSLNDQVTFGHKRILNYLGSQDNIVRHPTSSPSSEQPTPESTEKNRQKSSLSRQQKRQPTKKTSSTSLFDGLISSEWVLVTNVPPMSKLSDLLPSISKILQIELQRGIVDLNLASKRFMEQCASTTSDSTIVNQGSGDGGEAMNEINEKHSIDEKDHNQENTTENRPNDTNPQLPLWMPDSTLPPHMVLEARLHLSYRATPSGWFLRFPNRSVVHALLCHAREANKSSKTMTRKEKRNTQKRQAKLWKNWAKELKERSTEGIKNGSNEDKNIGTHSEKEVTHVDGERTHTEVQQQQATGATAPDGSSFHDSRDLEKSQSEQTPKYQQILCGSRPLDVSEFRPLPYHVQLDPKRPSSWVQHSFRTIPSLNLSDSVIRIENCPLYTKTEDIRLLFRGYDVTPIWPSPAEAKVAGNDISPSADRDEFNNFVKSIGWNTNPKQQSAFEILIQGCDQKNKSNGVLGPRSSHTFIARFASSADARAAIRQYQNYKMGKRYINVAQFPRQEI